MTIVGVVFKRDIPSLYGLDERCEIKSNISHPCTPNVRENDKETDETREDSTKDMTTKDTPKT